MRDSFYRYSVCNPILQTVDPLAQSRQVAGQTLVTQPQQTQLRIRPGLEAVPQPGAAGLDGLRQIQKPPHGLAAGKGLQGLGIVYARQQGGGPVGGGPENGHVPGQVPQLPQHGSHVLAAPVQPVQPGQSPGGVPPQDAVHQLHRLDAAGQAQNIQHRPAVQLALGHPALIQQAQGVPQGAVGHPGQNLRPVGSQVDLLGPGDLQQVLFHIPGQNALEGEALAPGENGGRDLVQLRGGQDEHQVLRRLLNGFQQGVEGLGGQHVDLVDDVDPLFQHRGGVYRLAEQLPDVVHPAVAGGVQLRHVQQGAAVDAPAGLALVAGGPVLRVQAVDGLGQNPGAGGFAGAPGAGEQIGVGRAALGHLPLEGAGDVVLAHHLGKGFGPPFPIQCLIHEPALPSAEKSEQNKLLRCQPRGRWTRGTWMIPLNAARFPA